MVVRDPSPPTSHAHTHSSTSRPSTQNRIGEQHERQQCVQGHQQHAPGRAGQQPPRDASHVPPVQPLVQPLCPWHPLECTAQRIRLLGGPIDSPQQQQQRRGRQPRATGWPGETGRGRADPCAGPAGSGACQGSKCCRCVAGPSQGEGWGTWGFLLLVVLLLLVVVVMRLVQGVHQFTSNAHEVVRHEGKLQWMFLYQKSASDAMV